jgi:hypothetical protein
LHGAGDIDADDDAADVGNDGADFLRRHPLFALGRAGWG